MGKANWYWDSKVNRWVARGSGGDVVAEFGTEIGLYGVAPVARQSHLADPTRGSATGNSDAIGSILAALETLGVLNTS